MPRNLNKNFRKRIVLGAWYKSAINQYDCCRQNMTDHNPIIVALDVESAAEARTLVTRIGPQVNLYKVGLELFTAAGMDGGVVSPLEAGSARAVTGPNAILVTPGVRSPGAAKGDQKRVATPADAIRDGADYVVIGRQITRSADPASTVRQILDEIRPELVETGSRL